MSLDPHHTRCLIVEDDDLLSEAFRIVLEDTGHMDVTPAVSEDEALDAIVNDRPDIALLDVDIVGGTSLGVATALLAKDVPLAFISGYEAVDLPHPFSSMPFLQKPVTRQQILSLVAALREAAERDLAPRES